MTQNETPDGAPSGSTSPTLRTSEEKATADEKPKLKRKRSFWFELPILLLVAVLVAVLVRAFLLQTFYIPSRSMEDTLLKNDRVLVNKIGHRFGDSERGEIVVFKPPESWGVGPNAEDYIKRVIGVGGDRVVCCDSQGRITVNGTALNEKEYLYPGDKPSTREFDVTVPDGRLWVMGDHRSASADSRVHMEGDEKYHGTIPEDAVVGRAFAIYWPISRMRWLSVPDTFDRL